MFYLIRQGISLRTSPIIQPSEISQDSRNIATSLVHRLFQQFQSSHYVVWGVLPKSEKIQKIINYVKTEYEKVFHNSIQLIENAEEVNLEIIKSCAKPCWLFVSNKNAHQLNHNFFIDKNISSYQKSYFTLTMIPFVRNQIVAEECNTQKRLSLDCLISVASREVHRKIKNNNKSYFFLRGYNESDFFLFIENL